MVDNGSTDDSVRTATSFRSRVGLIQLRHTGVAAARNAGLSSVREDFVAWLDADDVWKPDKLECRLAKIGDPSVGLVYGQIQDIGNNTLGDPWPTSFRKGTFLSGYICSGILFPPRRCSCDDKRLEMQVDLIPL